LLGDLICLKLQIAPRDRVLEIGCACGGFAIHAVRNYDARVTGSVALVLEDYRKLEGEYHKIASVEMFEGFDHYDELFGGSDRLLAVWRERFFSGWRMRGRWDLMSVSADVGFLSGVVRGSVSRTIYKCGAVVVGEEWDAAAVGGGPGFARERLAGAMPA
jgi:hypothetical protein